MRESLKEKEQPISDLHNEKVVSSSALLIGTYESHDRTSLFFLNAFLLIPEIAVLTFRLA